MNPYLKAEFLLADGKPMQLTTHNFKNAHYKVRLSIGNLPNTTYSVTYRLHESFYNPVREIFEGKTDGFPLQISTYGDFIVRAEVNSGTGVNAIAKSLTKALRDHYGENCAPSIDKVIQQMALK